MHAWAADYALTCHTENGTFLGYDTDRTENYASNNYSIVACVFVAAGTCLPSHCLATMREEGMS
jgi:hypothetical protein